MADAHILLSLIQIVLIVLAMHFPKCYIFPLLAVMTNMSQEKNLKAGILLTLVIQAPEQFVAVGTKSGTRKKLGL
jgi:hypothetical protein